MTELQSLFLVYADLSSWQYDAPPEVDGLLILTVDNTGAPHLYRYNGTKGWVSESSGDIEDEGFLWCMWRPIFTVFDRDKLFQ